MSVHVVTHLNFAGNAREALEYYQSVLGGQLTITTYGQSGVPHDSATSDSASFDPVAADSPDADLVSFGMIMADGVALAAYDVFGSVGASGLTSSGLHGRRRADGLAHDEPFFLVLNGSTRIEIEPLWDALTADGTVIQALAPTPWSPAYGMVTDCFGVTWVLGAMS